MDETRREYWAQHLGFFLSVIPAMIANGLLPIWNVLPFACWLVISTLGFGVTGAVATPRLFPGMISGLIAGSGVFLGIWLYLLIRVAMTGHTIAWKEELVVGAILGYVPGLLLYNFWARPRA